MLDPQLTTDFDISHNRPHSIRNGQHKKIEHHDKCLESTETDSLEDCPREDTVDPLAGRTSALMGVALSKQYQSL